MNQGDSGGVIQGGNFSIEGGVVSLPLGASHFPPVLSPQQFTVTENSAAGTLVGTVLAQDAPSRGQ